MARYWSMYMQRLGALGRHEIRPAGRIARRAWLLEVADRGSALPASLTNPRSVFHG
jgi:hypothetical protein